MLNSILNGLVHSSTESENADENLDKQKTPWDWRKLLEVVKDVGSVVSIVLSLVKILQDLGLL
ncbi:MAG: hypothetical protein RM347_008950 [Nostoc sp. ChiQUE02]|uniref:hypothetical protein n=1 Tax=Nostoc sp. ChiQUE02 TaxID=3075377 RepID=UPI002AD2874C|nr:hypothetical protein [Nostoc sp. ChiQUE02]MDZ8232924.1 hypothetical protein [Nostoc sp. ChiQUE02]